MLGPTSFFGASLATFLMLDENSPPGNNTSANALKLGGKKKP